MTRSGTTARSSAPTADLSRRYSDRRSAGVALAAALRDLIPLHGCVVLGLPRGGVPVAFEVARSLALPLDIFVVRKLGMPGQPELAIGAIASGGVQILDDALIAAARIPAATVADITAVEGEELHRRERIYRGDRAPLALAGATALLVDDGLATGASMRAAIEGVRRLRAAHVIVAVPVGAPQTVRALQQIADEVICPLTPHGFMSVGAWYDDFAATSDDEVRALLAEATEASPSA